MEKNVAAISVGSNIEPETHIAKAKALLAADHTLLAESDFVTTAPIGFLDQPDFVNGAWLIETELNCDDLQTALKTIEKKCDRVILTNKFGPRTIDLDIAIFNNKVIDTDIGQRDFLKKSIKQILPQLNLDGFKGDH
jgi:2-amino-4-hydroxy-6-hydroxymethyldihydropteridine diphosphokinase